jgi:ketosteroid isomerase-like protein
METRAKTLVQTQHEAQFVQNVGAFMRRDFETIEATWRPDVVMEMPGTSWLAGTHRGLKDVSSCVLGLRQVLASEDRRTTFIHEHDQMIVRHDVMVHGPEHVAEMTLRVRLRYDREGKVESIDLEPEDLGLFDHVLNTTLRNPRAS